MDSKRACQWTSIVATVSFVGLALLASQADLRAGSALASIKPVVVVGTPYELPAGAELVPQIGHGEHGVKMITLSPDNNIVATGGRDRKLQLWDLARGKLLHSIEAYGNSGFGPSAMAFSPDGRFVLTSPRDQSPGEAGRAKLWDVASGKLVHVYDDGFGPFAFSSDGKRFFSVSSTGAIFICCGTGIDRNFLIVPRIHGRPKHARLLISCA